MNPFLSSSALIDAPWASAGCLGPTKSSPIEDERLIQIIAAHESGHVLMLENFGVPAQAFIECDLDGQITGGVTVSENHSLTSFQRSIVGWGGIVAEYVLNLIMRPTPQVPPLQSNNIDQWSLAIRQQPWSEPSQEDRLMIALARDSSATARYTARAFLSPTGSGLLWHRIKELLQSFRAEHARSAEQCGAAVPTEVRELARRLVGDMGVAT